MARKHKKRPLHIPRTPEQIEAVRQRIREQTEAYKRMKEEQRSREPFVQTSDSRTTALTETRAGEVTYVSLGS
jgi:hypothetical protein